MKHQQYSKMKRRSIRRYSLLTTMTFHRMLRPYHITNTNTKPRLHCTKRSTVHVSPSAPMACYNGFFPIILYAPAPWPAGGMWMKSTASIFFSPTPHSPRRWRCGQTLRGNTSLRLWLGGPQSGRGRWRGPRSCIRTRRPTAGL